ncbi:hypothetical protein NADE_008050 [Nannochloris sp. 'desiccata']|nr:hypothetical protein NADE_008050 [Chlorella desiccata (nom. nud.)]
MSAYIVAAAEAARVAVEAARVAAEGAAREKAQKAARARNRDPTAAEANKQQQKNLKSMLERPSARGEGGRKRKLNLRYA